jgi:GMP synthase (glutamine-hydrolysing)
MGVPTSWVEPFDLLRGEASYERVSEGADAVLVGGSGEWSILDDDPWIRPFLDTVAELADRGFPTFASCFGFQAMVLGLGGDIVHDEANAEVGSYELELTSPGIADPLFGSLPQRFWAQMGHKDRATRLPESAVHLVRSARCPYQAIRIAGKPVYATQFHPELTDGDNLARFEGYHDLYLEAFGEHRVRAILDQFNPSPEANDLLRRFVADLQHGRT